MSEPFRSLGRRALLALLTAIAVVLGLLNPGPATAADGDVVIQINGFDQSLVVDPNFNTLYPGTSNGVQAASQCVDVPGVGKSCMGIGTPNDQPPLEVVGLEELSPVIKDAEAQAALGWMVPEAVEAVRTVHDLPNDVRVEQYARPQIRAWMLLRLQGIMDSYVYGVPLTEDEQRALDYVNAEFAEDDLVLAESAMEQYDRFMDVGCGFHPPGAPEAIDKPVQLPEDVREWCSHPQNQVVQLSTFAPPIPTASAFTEWGAYAKSQALGLDVLSDERMAENLRTSVVSGAVFGGIGAGAALGVLAGQLALAAGVAGKIAAKIAPHAGRAFFAAGEAISGGSGAIAGAIAAAAIAFVVVVFIVVTAVATWQLIQHDSVGKTLQDRLDVARTSTDPLGLEPLRAEWSGLPVGSQYDREDPPSYLSEAATMKTTFKIAQITSVVDDPQSPLDGQVIGDSLDTWPDNTTRNSDFRFIKQVGNGPKTVTDFVRLPTRDGEIRVRFSRGWLLVDEGHGERPAASFTWIRGGEKLAVSRAPAAVGGWQLSSLQAENGRYAGQTVVNLSYRNADDKLVAIGLTNPAKKYDAGPRPSAVGPLTTGRVLNLRPNPVTPTGVSVDPAQAETDYDFAWTVSALQPDGSWQDIETGSGYGLAFTPATATQYRARVTMTSVVDPTQQQFGYVDFAIQPPAITTPFLTLQDNGTSRLELDLQVQEEVPTDDLVVDVTWPGDLGSTDPNPTTELELDCVQTGPLDCTSVRTGPSNLLVHQVTTGTDLRQPVTVTITNSAGGALTQQFLIGSNRPQVIEPPADSNAGMPGNVLVSEGTTQLTVPLENRNHTYSVATLVPTVPGDGFGLVDPQTGNTTVAVRVPGTGNLIAKVELIDGLWHLVVQGTLPLKEAGIHEVPLVVAQTNGDRALVNLVVHVVPSTGDRYRGGLTSNVDPLDFATDTLPEMFPVVLGGRATWPAYAGGMCVSLQHRDFGLPPKVKCGDLAEFAQPDGTPRPFPYAELFPGGMPSGSYEAKAWLTGTDAEQVDPAPLWATFILNDDVIYGDPAVLLGRVSLSGQPVVGSRLRTRIEDVYPGGVDVTFRWLRDGNRIAGEAGSTYRLTRADLGHRIKVVVTATRSGWVRDTRASQATSRVRRG